MHTVFLACVGFKGEPVALKLGGLRCSSKVRVRACRFPGFGLSFKFRVWASGSQTKRPHRHNMMQSRTRECQGKQDHAAETPNGVDCKRGGSVPHLNPEVLIFSGRGRGSTLQRRQRNLLLNLEKPLSSLSVDAKGPSMRGGAPPENNTVP